MATETNLTIEVYDLATGQHYTREYTPEEMVVHEQLAIEQASIDEQVNDAD